MTLEYMTTFEKLRQVSQGEDYTRGCLLDYPYFKGNYKLIAIDFSKQQAVDDDPKAIQQINFTGNLDQREQKTMFLIIKEVKETIQTFHKEP